MAQLGDSDMSVIKKRNASDSASVSGSSTSDESTRKRKRSKNKDKTSSSTALINGGRKRSAFEQRRDSLGKAARDPRDRPTKKKRATTDEEEGKVVRSPSPVIDFDGLSRPSTLFTVLQPISSIVMRF